MYRQNPEQANSGHYLGSLVEGAPHGHCRGTSLIRNTHPPRTTIGP